MKVIFLDFDGVINPITFHNSASGFSKAACANLQSVLTKDPNVRIVISSSWRRNGLENCRKILKDNGIDPTKAIAVTDEDGGWLPDHRESQIKRWLDAHKSVKQFLILDDYPMPRFGDHSIKVNSYVGLTQKDAEIALRMLCK